MHQYEIEIKSLLGSKDKADELVNKMKAADASLQEAGSHSQLNHYFVPTTGNLKTLLEKVAEFLSADEKNRLEDLANRAKDFSVRTRDADGKIILVVKASVDDTTSSNGTARLEFEIVFFPSPYGGGIKGEGVASIDDLDRLILSAGFSYQAKWSRQRSNYILTVGADNIRPLQDKQSVSVSIDKNAGYGYLAEFEIVVDNANKAEETKAFLRQLMVALGAEELPQDRLARMFDHYNKNWQDYYGTEKIFNIE